MFSDVREYCMQDRFNVSCKVDEVIMMTSALYGRMKAGHCKIGETKLKCAVDILPNMDKMCSGFRSCDFVFPGTNTGIFDKKPCGHDHLSYMEASHECVKGMYRLYLQKKIRSSREVIYLSCKYNNIVGIDKLINFE